MALKDVLTKELLEHKVYELNLRFSDVAKEYNVSPSIITRIAKIHGVKAKSSGDWRDSKYKFAKTDLEKLYLVERKSAQTIGKELGIGTNTVNRLLDMHNIPRRSKLDAIRIERANSLNFNLGFFKKDSPEKFYILGLIASDGCVWGNSIKFTSKDKELVDYVKLVTACTNSISEETHTLTSGSSRSYNVQFSSVELVSILEDYGISENKSLTLAPKNIPQKYMADFIRGVFDGDGSVSVRKRKDTGVIASKFLIVTASVVFANIIHTELSKLKIDVNKITKDNRGNGIYTVSVGSRKSISKVTEWLYGENLERFGLTRKKQKMITIRDLALGN